MCCFSYTTVTSCSKVRKCVFWKIWWTDPLKSQLMLGRVLNTISVSVSAVMNFLNSHWGRWVKCQQLFLARLESFYQWNWYLALCSPDNDSSVGFSLWRWSILMLGLQLVPSWLGARGNAGFCQEQRCPSPLGVKTLFALFFSASPTSSAVSLLCPSRRAITGVHASTASIRQHDHVSEEGTLRRHGVRCGRTRRHHRSQWWRGGVCSCIFMHT